MCFFRYLITLLTLTTFLSGCNAARPAATAKKTAVAVELIEVHPETLDETLRLTGDVMPWEKLGLSFKVGGRLQKILVDEGDSIHSGQLIAEIDPTDYALTRKLAQSQVDALKPHLERARKLRKADVVPESNLEELESRYSAASLQLSQAKAQLSYAKLYAPMDGVVLKRMAAQGDMVGTSRPVIALVDLSRVKVILPLAQRHISRIRKGQTVTLTAPGIEGSREGRIHTIGLAADPKTRTIPITVEIDNADGALRAGMLATVEIKLGQSEGLFLPFDVITRDLRGKPKVLVYQQDTQTLASQEIVIGELRGDRIHILSGLKEGDRILYRGIAFNGDWVQVDSRHPSNHLDQTQPVPTGITSKKPASPANPPESAEATP